jgi:hypothetical protein
MPLSHRQTASYAPAGERHESLLVDAAVSIIRLDRLRGGTSGHSACRFLSEARAVLQAIQQALEFEPSGTDSAASLKTSRDLLQRSLADLAKEMQRDRSEEPSP